MKPFVRYTALFLALVFLTGAAFVCLDVFTHDNFFSNPELKIAAGALTREDVALRKVYGLSAEQVFSNAKAWLAQAQ